MSDAIAVLRSQVPEKLFRFAELAMEHLDLAKAAAGVGAPGEGRALMMDRRVQLVLAALGGELRETHKEARHQAVAMVAAMCSADPADAFLENGLTFKNIHDMPREVRMTIEGVKFRPDGGMEIKFSKRLDALRLLFTLFGDIPNEITASGGTARVHFHGRGVR